MTVSIEPHKKPRLRAPAVILYILLSVILITLPRQNLLAYRGRALPDVRLCGRVVLVSAARHGSTWFTDSAEQCTSENGTYGRLNVETELWNKAHEGSLVRDLDPENAALYVRNNRSVKVFPLALQTKGSDFLQTFFSHVKRLQIPVFVLRRNLEHSYDSRQLARETKVWSSSKGPSKRREIVKDKEFYKYQERIASFFEDIERILEKVGLTWDEFDYDDVAQRMLIIGERNRCFIRNCNFVP